MNAANEVVVAAFLEDKIGFLEMSEVIERCMDEIPFVEKPELEDYIQSDKQARTVAQRIIESV